MGHHQHRDVVGPADRWISAATALWFGRSGCQRLVEQKDRGTGDEGAWAISSRCLLLPAGELSDRTMRVGARADELDDLGDPRLALAGPGAPPAHRGSARPSEATVEAEPDDVDAAHGNARSAASLRQADELVLAAGGRPVARRSRAERLQPEARP